MRCDRRLFADQLLAASRAHDAGEADRRRRFRNVESETAEFLALLIRCTHASRILEIGTSNGYSTIWLADAAETTAGSVVSVDVDLERSKMARMNLARVGLGVELRTEDGARTLETASDGCWDFIFLDAERPAYATYWLRPGGGLLAIDNVLSHADEVVDVARLIEGEPSVESVLVPVGAGVRLAVRT